MTRRTWRVVATIALTVAISYIGAHLAWLWACEHISETRRG